MNARMYLALSICVVELFIWCALFCAFHFARSLGLWNEIALHHLWLAPSSSAKRVRCEIQAGRAFSDVSKTGRVREPMTLMIYGAGDIQFMEA